MVNINFEDCAFVSDLDMLEKYKDSQIQCITAFDFNVPPTGPLYHLTFSNCVFLGLHHSFLSLKNRHLTLTFKDTLFKLQHRETLLLPMTPSSLTLSDCHFSKSCCNSPSSSSLYLGPACGGTNHFNLNTCTFRKCYGSALRLEHSSLNSKQIATVTECNFLLNGGEQAAL